MSETVKILERSGPAIAIWNAICAVKTKDFIERLKIEPNGNDTVAEVSMFVNGKEVPVIASLAEFIGMYTEHVRQEASRQALKMVTGAGLQDLVSALNQAQYDIEAALENTNLGYIAELTR